MMVFVFNGIVSQNELLTILVIIKFPTNCAGSEGDCVDA